MLIAVSAANFNDKYQNSSTVFYHLIVCVLKKLRFFYEWENVVVSFVSNFLFLDPGNGYLITIFLNIYKLNYFIYALKLF